MGRVVQQAGQRAAGAAIKKFQNSPQAVARVSGAAQRVASTAAKVGRVAARVTAVAGAFAVGYAIGTGLRAAWQRLQPAERNYRKALAFRRARERFAAETGREMTRAEVIEMGNGFQESLS